MGKVKNLAIDIMAMAEKLNDRYGFEHETVEYIATEFQISCDEVQAVLDTIVPQEYAEQAVDLDAEYYGRA
jgi:hypothetical protein